MIRKSIAFAVMMFMLITFFSGIAGAEDPEPATPTDLYCLHEHIRTVIYFYDSPAYTSVSSASHRVSGPAVIETVCEDCGEVLTTETVDQAEESRPHTMKKGVCALCGYREKARTTQGLPADMPGERTIYAQADGSAEGLMTLTLSTTDLSAMKKANVRTVLVRGQTGTAVIALEVSPLLSQTEEFGADLYMELAEREDGSFFAGLYLICDPGEKQEPEDDGITLRFYQESKADVRVSLAPVDEGELVETRGEWNEHGYWTVKYLEEGTYFLFQ